MIFMARVRYIEVKHQVQIDMFIYNDLLFTRMLMPHYT